MTYGSLYMIKKIKNEVIKIKEKNIIKKIFLSFIIFLSLISFNNICKAFTGLSSFNNSPRMIFTVNEKKYDDVKIQFTDYSGLSESNIKFYTAKDGKQGSEISDSKFIKKIEYIRDNNKNRINSIIYTISDNYLNKSSKEFYVIVGDANNSISKLETFFRIVNKDKKYTIDLSPRVGSWEINNNNITIDACDYSGINYVKLYDLNSGNSSDAIVEKNNLPKGHSTISFSINKFAQKNGVYRIKVISQDKTSSNKNKLTSIRTIQFGISEVTPELDITNLNIGVAGDAVLLQSRGKALLMDSGANDESSMPKYYWGIKNGQNKVIQELQKANVTNLSIYLSHWHCDHFDMIPEIMNNNTFKIENIYLPEFTYMDNNKKLLDVNKEYLKKYDQNGNKIANPTEKIKYNYYKDAKKIYDKIKTIAKNKGITITYLKYGSKFSLGDANIKILGPKPNQSFSSNINNYSLVAMCTVGDIRFLSAGDIEKEAEQSLLNSNADISADIMKLSHHGINTSNTVNFLKKVNPKYAFYTRNDYLNNNKIGLGTWNSISNLDTLKTNLYGRTSNGTVKFSIKGNEINVTPEKNYYTIKINYVDSNTGKVLKAKTHKFHVESKDNYNPKNNYYTKYYLYNYKINISGYKYDTTKNKDFKSSGKALQKGKAKTLTLYYKK